MKLENTAMDVDFFRNDPELTPEVLKSQAEIWGMPTLYLPNRLSHGNLKTSDAIYHFHAMIRSATTFMVSAPKNPQHRQCYN